MVPGVLPRPPQRPRRVPRRRPRTGDASPLRRARRHRDDAVRHARRRRRRRRAGVRARVPPRGRRRGRTARRRRGATAARRGVARRERVARRRPRASRRAGAPRLARRGGTRRLQGAFLRLPRGFFPRPGAVRQAWPGAPLPSSSVRRRGAVRRVLLGGVPRARAGGRVLGARRDARRERDSSPHFCGRATWARLGGGSPPRARGGRSRSSRTAGRRGLGRRRRGSSATSSPRTR